MKNLILLISLIFVTLAFAKEPIEKESMQEAENFKVEKAAKEKSAGRAFAGSRAKKEVPEAAMKEEIPNSEDSEVRYWRYSE